MFFCDANYVCELNCKMGFEHIWCNFKFVDVISFGIAMHMGVLLQGFANSFQVDEITYENTYMRSLLYMHKFSFL